MASSFYGIFHRIEEPDMLQRHVSQHNFFLAPDINLQNILYLGLSHVEFFK